MATRRGSAARRRPYGPCRFCRRPLVGHFVLFFIQPGTRQVHIAGITANPDSVWMAQQARNLCMFFDDLPERPRSQCWGRRTWFATSGSVGCWHITSGRRRDGRAFPMRSDSGIAAGPHTLPRFTPAPGRRIPCRHACCSCRVTVVTALLTADLSCRWDKENCFQRASSGSRPSGWTLGWRIRELVYCIDNRLTRCFPAEGMR
jgi:hypothetical protein